jgi:signal transduction histidine kinase
LDVSNIQGGQLKLNIKEFAIDDFLNETIQAFQVITKTHQIVWDGGFTNETIAADRQRLEQVFINLLSNAIKYSPGENKVIVNSSKTNKELIVKIRDFGIGVPIDEQSNIFERFYRAKDTSKNISGFGLGLYISKDIIKRHNGRIWVEREDRGSAFYFSLPLKNGLMTRTDR